MGIGRYSYGCGDWLWRVYCFRPTVGRLASQKIFWHGFGYILIYNVMFVVL